MAQDTTSFWTDIKKYEDILANDPNSYCFAPLADLYRKLGLLDDAIAVARRGHEKHPEFVSGCLVLGRSYLEKGMKEEGKPLLEKVARSTPENLQAQKLLSQIYAEEGSIAAAEKTLQLILSLNPDDTESRVLLDSLAPTARVLEESGRPGTDGYVIRPEAEMGLNLAGDEDEELIIEDAELIEELDEEWDLPGQEIPAVVAEPEEGEETAEQLAESSREGKDPLTTGTLAELYVSQGFVDRAVAIYRELLQNDPDNGELRARMHQLETSLESPAEEPEADEAVTIPTAQSEEFFAAPVVGQSAGIPVTPTGVLETLEVWLKNIKRRGQCHSETPSGRL